MQFETIHTINIVSFFFSQSLKFAEKNILSKYYMK